MSAIHANSKVANIIQLHLIDANPALCQKWRKYFPPPTATITNTTLTELPTVDCLVIPSDSYGSFAGGFSRRILTLFEMDWLGPKRPDASRLFSRHLTVMDKDLYKRVQQSIAAEYDGSQPVGTCLLLETHNPKVPFIAHAPTMSFAMDISRTSNAYLAMSAVLQTITSHNQTSSKKIKIIGCPGLGTGVGGLRYENAARQMADAYKNIMTKQVLELGPNVEFELIERVDKLVSKLPESPKKRTFLEMFDHDARNYLMIILNRITMLSDAIPNEIKTRIDQNLSAIKNSADLLLKLIDDLNNYEMIKAAKIKLTFSAINIPDVLKEVVNQLEPRMNQSKIQCCLPNCDHFSGFLAHADHLAINRVLFNVILNAIKYSEPKTTISIKISHQEYAGLKKLLILIADQGHGIPKADWKNIFEPHFRRNSELSGRGLGLTIAKELLTLMDGEIGVQDSAEDQGTTFYIRIPAAEQPLVTN